MSRRAGAPTDDALPAGQSTRFGRDRRLIHRAQFDAVFKASDFRFRSHPFTILGRDNGTGSARLGLALAKRQLPRAVDRNRVRRLVRESFRRRHDLPGADLVVMAAAPAAGLDNPTLDRALEQLWQRLRTTRQNEHAARP